MTVSPDGRFAAFKLKSNTTYSRTELADDSAILLISLTGERIAAWGDEVYLIIDTGSNGTSSEGQYQFASSLTLTNRYLYYLIGSGSDELPPLQGPLHLPLRPLRRGRRGRVPAPGLQRGVDELVRQRDADALPDVSTRPSTCTAAPTRRCSARTVTTRTSRRSRRTRSG